MKQKSLRFLIISLCFYLLTGLLYLPSAVGKELVPPSVPAMIALDRQIPYIDQAKLKEDFLNLLYRFDSLQEDIVDERLFEYSETKPIWLSKEEALEDVEWLFKILKYAYGPYGYWGGDEVFLPIKAALSEEIKGRGERIPTTDFVTLLIENLAFIKDSHFYIEASLMALLGYMQGIFPKCFIDDNNFFYQDSQGYYTFIDGEKYYLLDEEGASGKPHLKLCLDCEGCLAFCLAQYMSSAASQEAVTIQLQGPDDIINKKFTLIAKALELQMLSPHAPIYNYKEIAGIPLVECKSFCPPGGKYSEDLVWQLYNFSEDAKELKTKDVIILDLRGNRGGYPAPGQRWLENLTGQRIYNGFISFFLENNLTESFERNYRKNNFEEGVYELFNELFDDSLYALAECETIDTIRGWGKFSYSPPRRVKNDNLIFVIIDISVASASEHFIAMLRQVDNVVFVGENSIGCTLSNSGDYCLPRSGTPVGFGNYLCLDHELVNKDLIGFAPDIYAPSHEAVDRLMKFIARYDLETLKYNIKE